MRKSKFLALLLAVAMVVSMVVVPAYAADEYTITLADAEGNTAVTVAPTEETLDLYLYVKNNPGFMSAGALIDIPDGWTLAAVADTSMAAATLNTQASALLDMSHSATSYDPYKVNILANIIMGAGMQYGDGPIAKLTFNLPEEPSAEPYTFVVDVTTEANLNNVGSGTTLDVKPVNCQVTVSSGEEPAGSTCPECGAVGTWTEVEEGAWNAGITLTEGHYKLMGNQTLSAKNTPIVVAADTKVCIDLNGKNITQTIAVESATTNSGSKFARVFENSGELTILDSTAKTEAGTYTSGVISGGWVTAAAGKNNDAGGNIYNASGATFNLHSGTLSGGIVRKAGIGETLSTTGGGNIFGTGAEINIYGGLVMNGKAYTDVSTTNSTADRTGTVVGGNISVYQGSLNIEGGTISGGQADNTTSYSKTQGSFASYGGNIFINDATVSITGGTIENGTANIATTGANNGSATSQTSTARGGNLYIMGAANVTVGEDAVIRGGRTSASTAAASGKTLTKITNNSNGGNIYTVSSGDVTINGTITGGSAEDGGSIYVHSGEVILDAALSTGAATRYGGGVYLKGGELTVNGEITECTSGNRGAGIYQDNGTLNLYGEITGCTSTKRGGGINALNSAVTNVYDGAEISGNTDNEKYGSAVTITGNSANLNIYGGLLSSSQSGAVTVYSLYSNINLYDGIIEHTVANGGAIGQYYSSSHNKPTVTMYGGHVAGRLRAITDSVVNIYGGTVDEIYESSTGTKIYNGVVGNECADYLADCACYFEGHVWNYKHIAGTCTAECPYEAVLAADASNNNYTIVQQTGDHTPAADSSNLETGYSCGYCGVSVAAPENVKVGNCAHDDHGEVTWLAWDGVATDGHYYVEESFTLDGMVTISSGEELCLDLNGKTVTAKTGGKRMFDIAEGGTLNLMDSGSNGTLQGVTSTDNGAVIRSNGTFNFYDGIIQGGIVAANSDSGTYAGNVYIGKGTFNMSGGTIKDGVASNQVSSATVAGGNLYVTGSAQAVITGGTISGGSAEHGGNIAANTGAQVAISSNVEISGGTATGYGDNIWVRGKNSDGVNTLLTIGNGVLIGAGTTEIVDFIATADGEIEIEAGVTLYDDPAQYLTCEAAAFNGETYKTFDSEELIDALTAAQDYATANGSVTLGKDITFNGNLVLSVTKLDLNGKALTVKGDLEASMTNIVDASGDASITVEGEHVATSRTNEYLPVSVNGAVKLLKPTNYNKGSQYNAGNTTKKFAFYLNGTAAENIVNAIDKEEVTLKIRLLKGNEEVGTYVVPTEILEQYAVEDWANKVIMVTATGAEADAEYSIEVICASASGTIYTTAYAED